MTTVASIRKIDFKFGEQKEKDLKLPISEYLGLSLKRTKPYSVFDYECDTAYVELKSRRTPLNQFPTTIIGKNKLDKAKEVVSEGKKVYFVIDFPEALLCWEYCSEQADKIVVGKCGRRDRGRNEIKDYSFVPISYFQTINPKPLL